MTSCTFIIFGGTGDLTHRKLIPAFYNLQYENLLPEHFAIVAVGRRPYTDDEYRKELAQSVKKFSRFQMHQNIWEKLSAKIYYKQADFTEAGTYDMIHRHINQIETLEQTEDNRIYYLAVAPEFFAVIVDNLSKNGMAESKKGFSRVVIEKPFGRDLKSAEYLNKKIVSAFKEENTYRIDHYLGKEMLQNIMVIRFANTLFEPIWNNRFIRQIQISSSETLGVETRGEYYEKSGAIRDMVQSHLLQLLSLITMEKPDSLSPGAIRDEKVKVINALKQYTDDEVKEFVVRGQYAGYRNEKRVAPDSDTETFVAMKLEVQNNRFKGVPIYLRTGKKLKTKSTEIIIEFKQPEDLLYKSTKNLASNILVIRIQPLEGVFFQFNAKKPGTKHEIIPVQMDFCQNCQIGINSPEAYERLLHDVIKGDATLFTRWDEVEKSWQFIDSIQKAWAKEISDFPNYEPGTNGPNAAERLLAKDGNYWIDTGGETNDYL